MRYLTFAAALALVLAALAFAVPGALAKGPFSLVVTGGGLPEPVPIGGPFTIEKMLTNPDAYPVRLDPPPAGPSYTVEFHPPEGASSGEPLTTLAYFPAGTGRPALLRNNEGLFMPVARDFESLIDAKIAAALGLRAADPTSDGTSPLWYIAPSLAVGLLLLGGGLAGRRLLLRRNA